MCCPVVGNRIAVLVRRLLVALLLPLMGFNATTTVISADACMYGGPLLARVEVDATTASVGAMSQFSLSMAGGGDRSLVTLSSSTTSSRTFIATNFGEGGSDFNQAMNAASEWLLARGFKAEVPTIGKFGSTAGRPIGMQTADGKVGFRVENTPSQGAHINVRAHEEKGPNFDFAASEPTVTRIQRLFGGC